MKGNLNQILLIAIFLSILIVPKIAFSSNGLHDSFNYSNTALAQTAVNEGAIQFHPYENAGNSINRHANGWSVRWAVTSSIASISLVSGLSPRELQSLPICAIGILIMAFLVASKLLKDWRFASLYTIMIAFDPTVNMLTNGTYIQGWGFIFYFMLIYLTIIIVERKHYLALRGNAEHRGPFLLYGSLVACSLAMMYFTYYSALIYGAILLSVVGAGIYLTHSSRILDRKKTAFFLAAFAVMAVLLYLLEPTTRFAVANFGGLFKTAINFTVDVVRAGGSRFYVGLLSYMLIFVPILLLGHRWLASFVRARALPAMTTEGLFVSAFLATGFINVVIYTGLGLVDLKYFIMFFTLVSLYALRRVKLFEIGSPRIEFRKLHLRQIFALILTLLFVMKFVTYMAPVMAEDPYYQEGSMAWLSEHCLRSGSDSISELKLSGELMLRYVERGNIEFNSFIFSSYYLNSLASGNKSEFLRANGEIEYMVMTDANMAGHFSIGNWQTWNTDDSPVDTVSERDFIHRIYSSRQLSVWWIDY